MDNTLRTIETATSPGFLKTLLEEKIEMFGFAADDQILSIEIEGLPEIIPLKIKFKKERGATVTVLSDGKEES
jgi:hypothetical protein